VETTSSLTDACENFRHAWLHIKLQQAQVCYCPSRLRTASIFPSFDTPLPLILFNNLARLVLLNSCAEILVVVVEIRVADADFGQVAPLCVINLMNLELTVSASKCAKNHANCFRRFEDVSSPT